MNRSTKHAIAAFLVAALACCTSWDPPVSLSRGLLEKRPSHLQVTLTSGERFDVVRPTARGDTLLGDTLIDLGDDRVRRSHVAIPFGEVRSVSTRHFAADRTVALAVGLAAVAGVVAIIAEDVSHGIMGGGLGGGSGCAGPKETWPD